VITFFNFLSVLIRKFDIIRVKYNINSLIHLDEHIC